MPVLITVAKKHHSSVTVTSFHDNEIERGLRCLVDPKLLAYLFVLSTNPCTRFSVSERT
jgi:hypothetical protein